MSATCALVITNVAVAAARLGRHSAVFTKVGADAFGDYVVDKLHGFGVDTRYVGRHATLRTPLAFAVMEDPAEPSIIFYREPQAPDMALTVDDAVLAEAGSAVPPITAGPDGAQILEHFRTIRAL